MRTGAHVATTIATWCLVPLAARRLVTSCCGSSRTPGPGENARQTGCSGVLERFAGSRSRAPCPGLLTARADLHHRPPGVAGRHLFLSRVERGEIHVGWLDRDTAGPTRRIGTFRDLVVRAGDGLPVPARVDSDAFKGVSCWPA